MKPIFLNKLVFFVAINFSGFSYAAGNHAGGHSHHAGEETAIGKPGLAKNILRTINITMSDNMRFTPSNIVVKSGDTLRFAIKNEGKVKHEMSLGTQKELLEHLELMKKFPEMEHDEPNSVTLAPGQKGEIVWQFTKSGVVNFACLMPGHFEAGMKGVINVGKK